MFASFQTPSLVGSSGRSPTSPVKSPQKRTASLERTMKAVVLDEPFHVTVRDIPLPKLIEDTDVIIKVKLSGLCGSDLHPYRGHEPPPYGYVLGHEVVGTVCAVGEAVQDFRVGDEVVSAFHTACGDCYYCERSLFARCVQARCIGSSNLQGAQAEYFRCPLADTTLLPLPTDLPKELVLLMADILPTGYAAAFGALLMLDAGKDEPTSDSRVCVVVGCGPVGLCAITSALTMFDTVYATDLVLPRLVAANRHGATALPVSELQAAIMQVTDGRGADAVIEAVGNSAALITACELARPCGVVSSCGVHTRPINISGDLLYSKNLRLQFGRCAVRAFFQAGLDIIRDNRELFDKFIENRVSIKEAPEYYKLFEQNKVGKTVFVFDQ